MPPGAAPPPQRRGGAGCAVLLQPGRLSATRQLARVTQGNKGMTGCRLPAGSAGPRPGVQRRRWVGSPGSWPMQPLEFSRAGPADVSGGWRVLEGAASRGCHATDAGKLSFCTERRLSRASAWSSIYWKSAAFATRRLGALFHRRGSGVNAAQPLGPAVLGWGPATSPSRGGRADGGPHARPAMLILTPRVLRPRPRAPPSAGARTRPSVARPHPCASPVRITGRDFHSGSDRSSPKASRAGTPAARPPGSPSRGSGRGRQPGRCTPEPGAERRSHARGADGCLTGPPRGLRGEKGVSPTGGAGQLDIPTEKVPCP